MKILNNILSTVSLSHREAIKEILNQIRKKSLEKTSREIQFDAQRLVNLIKNREQIFIPHFATPLARIDSDLHNENMESAFVDLKALYSESSHISNIQSQQKASIESTFNKARAAIFKLITDARVFTIRSRNPEFDDIKLVNFNISNNQSKRLPQCTVDKESRLLKLPEVLKIRNHTERRNQSRTKSRIEILSSGQKGQLSTGFEPKLALDGKTETFWGEVIYSNEPLQTKYIRGSLAGNSSLNETIQGPVLKYILEYSKAEPVNQIKILPFAPHEIKVLDITYKPNSSSTVSYPVPGFTVEESLDWIEYNFETVYAQSIEIVFAQESYREFIVKVPRHILFSTDFLLELLQERKEELQEIPQLDSVNIGGNHKIYQEAIEDLSKLIEEKDLSKTPSTEIDLAGKTIMSIGEALAGFSPDVSSLIEDVSTYTESLPKDFSNQIESFTKYEYIIGAKEIQTNLVMYAPSAIYESAKFDTKATVTFAKLEVDERLPTIPTLAGERSEVSSEWEIEFSEDRRVPIYPVNQTEGGLLPVKGERLVLDPITRFGLSRFPANMSYVLVRKNKELLVDGVDYTVTWNGILNKGKLKIEINEEVYNSTSIYTIDYMAASSSTEIDVLSLYKAKRISKPDSFEKTDTDKKVELSYYPYVNYGILNSEVFIKDSNSSDYVYIEPTGAYGTYDDNLNGTLLVQPNWENASGIIPDSIISGSKSIYLQSGDTYGTGSFYEGLSSGYLLEPYSYYLRLEPYYKTYEIESIVSDTELLLKEVPLLYTGLIGNEIDDTFFSGNILESGNEWPSYTGASTGFLDIPYSIHVIYKDNDEVFGFDNLIYTPIDVKIGGTKAVNITDYINLEQPAFTVADSQDEEIEFIHDGKNLYFNQSVSNTEILVDYKKVIDYIKVNCILRANKVINPTVSPQINEYRLLLNTSIL